MYTDCSVKGLTKPKSRKENNKNTSFYPDERDDEHVCERRENKKVNLRLDVSPRWMNNRMNQKEFERGEHQVIERARVSNHESVWMNEWMKSATGF